MFQVYPGFATTGTVIYDHGNLVSYPTYNRKTAFGFGITQIVIGSALVVFNIIGIIGNIDFAEIATSFAIGVLVSLFNYKKWMITVNDLVPREHIFTYLA